MKLLCIICFTGLSLFSCKSRTHNADAQTLVSEPVPGQTLVQFITVIDNGQSDANRAYFIAECDIRETNATTEVLAAEIKAQKALLNSSFSTLAGNVFQEIIATHQRCRSVTTNFDLPWPFQLMTQLEVDQLMENLNQTSNKGVSKRFQESYRKLDTPHNKSYDPTGIVRTVKAFVTATTDHDQKRDYLQHLRQSLNSTENATMDIAEYTTLRNLLVLNIKKIKVPQYRKSIAQDPI